MYMYIIYIYICICMYMKPPKDAEGWIPRRDQPFAEAPCQVASLKPWRVWRWLGEDMLLCGLPWFNIGKPQKNGGLMVV